MREMIVNELTQATQELIREFARFLPRLMVMLIVVLVGWLIAYLVKWILRSILRLIKFDKLSEGAGATQLLNKAALALLHRTGQPLRLLDRLARLRPPGHRARSASWACRNM